MKKLLIASTALVASAGFAAADVSLSGAADFGVRYNSGAATNAIVVNEVEFYITGSGTTDGGLSFGASIDLESDNDGGNTVAATNQTNDGEVWISGEFGELRIGNVDGALDGFGAADIGFDGIGIDDVAEGGRNEARTYIQYKVTFDAFTLQVNTSGAAGTNDYSASARYDFGDIDAGVGVSRNAGGKQVTSIDVNGKFGDIGFEAAYFDHNAASTGANGAGAGVDGWIVSGSYTMGATKLVATIADNTAVGIDPAYGIGASYNLGGGATLAGGIGSVDVGATRNTVADFGISLTF